MELGTINVEGSTSSCNSLAFRMCSAVPRDDVMTGALSRFKPLVLALLLTLAQLAVAVLFLAPEGPLSYRYSTLIQHDSYWFMNIVDRGYATTVPPIDHKVMEVSNVAFFPAYPTIAALLGRALHLDADDALLITAQAAAWGFWSYFFLFCERWNVPPLLQFFGALSIVAHPAAFFLIAGYSESLFLMAVLGFIYWSGAEGRRAKVLAALHGIVMSATRIVGIPCAAFPVVRSVFRRGWSSLAGPRTWIRQHGPAIALMLAATLGALAFFSYCQLRWSRWDMYMLTQAAGWAIEPDYLALLRPSNYRWLVPALDYPSEASQMSVTMAALLFLAVAVCESIVALRRRRGAVGSGRSFANTGWSTRAGIYFCAFVIFFVSASGVAHVDMESMLRYEFSVHALIVLALLNFLRQFRVPPVFVRALGMSAVAVICAAGLSVQGWYVWNFTRGNWVA